MSAVLLDDLRAAGLLAEGGPSLLTDKGREWLRTMEEAETREIADDWEADLVQSVNGLSR